MIRALLVVLGVFLGCCAVYYAHWVLIRRRLVTIVPDRVYQSGAMSAPRLLRCARRLGSFGLGRERCMGCLSK